MNIPEWVANVNATEQVPAEWLSHGRWDGKTQKQQGEGKISESYSGDTIADGSRVRRPFTFGGSMWVCIGMGPGLAADAYRIFSRQVFEEMFHRPQTTYREKTRDSDASLPSRSTRQPE